MAEESDNRGKIKKRIKVGEKISLLFGKYKQERLTSGRWIEKTGLENQRCFDLFINFAGDHEPEEYKHQVFLEFRDLLQKLPPNLSTNPHTRSKSLSQIIKMKHGKTLSQSQINKYLICISTFFNWLKQHEIITQNPAHHLLLSRAKGRRPDEERTAYSISEIVAILQKVNELRDSFDKNQSRYWVPTIAAYSGMRLTEICQLYLNDLVQKNEIWCFDINEKEDKRLKTENSRRLLPIHDKLIEQGLLELVNELQLQGNERLFPELHKEKYNGYGRQMSKWFTAFNRKHITQDPLKTFHSIRHAIANELKQCGVETELISELLGHQVSSIAISRYGKPYRPDILLAVLKKLPW
jgi:integrase